MQGDVQRRTAQGLPSDDGFIQIELSKQPVPYHIVRCFEDHITPEDSRSLALSSCWLACRCTDVMRGRLAPSMLQRNLIYTILTRREMMVLRHKIAEIDPEAFINIVDSKEILGKGFKPLKEE